jgi:hypothetical protein
MTLYFASMNQCRVLKKMRRYPYIVTELEKNHTFAYASHGHRHVREELAQLRDHVKIGNSILLGVCEPTFYPKVYNC